MAYQLPITIAAALESIQRREYVLPAIQREFIWSKEQITRLFDSLLRGYPIGSFLFWTVTEANVQRYKYYGVMKDYHQLDAPHCAVLDLPADKPVTAILDGQQRLTALNIGLRGSHASRLPWKWWKNAAAYPVQYLYLNLCAGAPENELGMLHDFRFFQQPPVSDPAHGSHWFPVQRIFDPAIGGAVQLFRYANENNLTAAGSDRPVELLDGLFRAVHVASPISFYEEKDQDLDRVLHIFTRVNSGGTVLSYSDLLLSIATAQWDTLDAREEIQSLVDDLNAVGEGFAFSKDVVLKAGLMLTGEDVAFKVTNFDRTAMKKLEHSWPSIEAALLLAARLLADFGFSADTLTANSVFLPVAYYLYHHGSRDAYLSHATYAEDRKALRHWVTRTLIKPGIWGSGLDTLLRDLRRVFDENAGERFPSAAIESAMAARGKALTFSAEELAGLIETLYRDGRAFPLLALLFPHVDTKQLFHVDHIFPRAWFRRSALQKSGLPNDAIEEYQHLSERLPNLQLLEGVANLEKRAKPPLTWAKATYHDPAYLEHYLHQQDLLGLSDSVQDFPAFYQARKDRLLVRLGDVLGVIVVAEAADLVPAF